MKEFQKNKVNKLRLIQLLQLKLLVDIKKITLDLGVDYFLIAGSLLGSVRHSGFIPWDSDADIAMKRKHYNKLIDNIHLFGNDLFLQCDETDKKNKTGFAKLRLKDTVFIESGNKFEETSCHGFYIDIFPLDKYIYRNKFMNEINHYFYRYLTRLKSFKNGKKNSSTFARTIISKIICLPSIIMSLKTIINIQKKIAQKYNNTDSNYVNNFNSKYGLEKQYMPLDIYYPPSVVSFEKHEFTAPGSVDAWLKRIYGNYTKLPKKQIDYTNDLLKNYIIDFGKYSFLLGQSERFVLKELKLDNND